VHLHCEVYFVGVPKVDIGSSGIWSNCSHSIQQNSNRSHHAVQKLVVTQLFLYMCIYFENGVPNEAMSGRLQTQCET